MDRYEGGCGSAQFGRRDLQVSADDDGHHEMCEFHSWVFLRLYANHGLEHLHSDRKSCDVV